MLLHERKCSIVYVARGIDAAPRTKLAQQRQTIYYMLVILRVRVQKALRFMSLQPVYLLALTLPQNGRQR